MLPGMGFRGGFTSFKSNVAELHRDGTGDFFNGAETTFNTPSGLNIGTASSTRRVIAVIGAERDNSAVLATEVRFNGTAATMHVNLANDLDSPCASLTIASLLIPTGTTTQIAVEYPIAMKGAFITYFCITGETNPPRVASLMTTKTAALTNEIFAEEGSIVLCARNHSEEGKNITWSGATAWSGGYGSLTGFTFSPAVLKPTVEGVYSITSTASSSTSSSTQIMACVCFS